MFEVFLHLIKRFCVSGVGDTHLKGELFGDMLLVKSMRKKGVVVLCCER